MTAPQHLIMVTHYPEPENVRAGLADALGEQGAVRLQRSLTEHTLDTARAFMRAHRGNRSIELRFAGSDHDTMRNWLGNGISYIPLTGGEPGEWFAEASHTAFNNGAEMILLVGTGCPTLTDRHLEEAVSILTTFDLAIGPVPDGGQYLIGIHRRARLQAVPALFTGIAWGSGYMLGDILSSATNLGLSYRLLEQLPEVGNSEDLVVWDRARLSGAAMKQPLISAVIPTHNNAATIGATLDSLTAGRGIEIIVADNGSTDDTVLTAFARNAHVIETTHGRGAQLAAGIGEATGDCILLMLPGTILSPGFDRTIRNLLADPGIACGAFSSRIDSTRLKHHVLEYWSWFRAHILHLPGLAQGLFMRAQTLAQAGDIPIRPALGEFDLAHRLARHGRVAISPMRVTIIPDQHTGQTSRRNTANLDYHLTTEPLQMSHHHADTK